MKPLDEKRFPNIFVDGRTVVRRWDDGSFTEIKPRWGQLTLTDYTTDEMVTITVDAGKNSAVASDLDRFARWTEALETGDFSGVEPSGLWATVHDDEWEWKPHRDKVIGSSLKTLRGVPPSTSESVANERHVRGEPGARRFDR